MGLLKRLFGSEKKEEISQEDSLINENVESEGKRFIDKKCGLCDEIIAQEKYTKKGGRFFHKKCFKEQYKKLKAQGKVW